MSNPVKILVMSAGSMPGVAVINALLEQTEVPVHIVAADMGTLSPGFVLAHSSRVVPSAADPTFIPKIRAICREEGIQIVFPIIDEELQIFAENIETFAADGVRVISNSAETVRYAKDKGLTAQRCAELGVLAPQSLLREEIGQKPLPPFPLIIKPRDGRGSVGVYTARNQREFDFYIDLVPNAIIQQKIAGPEFTLDVLSDFEGRILSIVPKERLQVKGGMQVKGRTLNDPQLIQYGLDLAARFKVFPRGNIQCMRDADNRLYLIEINPKFAASLPFTVAAGVNMPLMLVQMHLGRRFEPQVGKFEAGLVMMRCWRELYVRGA